MDAVRQALRVPGFARLASTYALNELADWLAAIALAILVFDATGDPLAVTALFVANKFLPGLAVPALSARLERYRAARVLGAVYVVEALLLSLTALAATAFWLPLILVLALADGTLAACARALTRGMTPALMEKRGLLREANATLNIGFAAMNVGAPMLGGILTAVAGAPPVLVLAAVVFLVQAGIVARADLPGGEAEPAPWRERLGEAIAYARSRRRLGALLVGEFVVLVLAMMVAPIEVVLAKDTLDAGDVGVGALAGSWGAGMLVGSWLFARERKRSVLQMIAVATFAVGAGYLGMAAAPDITVACLAAALGGLGNGIQWVAVVTAIQEATEEHFQARVSGLIESVMTIGPGVAFPLGGLIAALLSPRAAFAVSGAGVLLVLAAGTLLVALRAPGPERAAVEAA